MDGTEVCAVGVTVVERAGTNGQRADEPRHPNGRKVRIDALPEYIDYRDRGCELAPSCLRCPLARCRYDQPGGARSLLQGPRDEAVRRRREDGLGIDALAAEFAISRRSVFRILARGRVTAGR